MENRLWTMKVNAATLILMIASIGINFLGKFIAELLDLPVWVDTVGTCLAAVLAGPIAGALTGMLTNILYGIYYNPISTIYALTNICIGTITGIMAYRGYCRNVRGTVFTGIAAGALAAVVSIPLNLVFWGGLTGNILGDHLFVVIVNEGFPRWLASTVTEVLMDLMDKILVMLIVFLAISCFPEKLRKRYENGEER